MPGFMIQGFGDGSRYINSTHPYGAADFYYSYTWEISDLFININGPGYNASRYPALIYLRDAVLPTFNVSKESVEGASLEYKFAKSVTWDDIRVVWYDTEGLIDIIRQWRELVWTPEGGLQDPSNYKCDSFIHNYLPDASSAVSWKLINSWPSSIRNGDLTYTGSDVKLVEVTIAYDWAIENIQRNEDTSSAGSAPAQAATPSRVGGGGGGSRNTPLGRDQT